MKQLINSLQELQSNSFIYSNLVKGFYLNTESVLMRQSQIVYKEIYLESDRLLMETSLWLRRLGGEALYTIEDISASQTLGNVKPDTYCGVEMATHLVPINKTMIEEIRVVTDQAIASKEWACSTFIRIVKEASRVELDARVKLKAPTESVEVT
jgi:DNA-binding ferritin-like protein